MSSKMTPHEILQQQLQEMSNEDMKQMLWNDPLVKSVMAAVPAEDRSKIEAFIVDFMDSWKQGAVDPIVQMASNPEFVKAFMKAITKDDPEAGGLGDLL